MYAFEMLQVTHKKTMTNLEQPSFELTIWTVKERKRRYFSLSLSKSNWKWNMKDIWIMFLIPNK